MAQHMALTLIAFELQKDDVGHGAVSQGIFLANAKFDENISCYISIDIHITHIEFCSRTTTDVPVEHVRNS